LAGCATDRRTVGVTDDQFGTLRVRNWTEYIDPELLPIIEADIGVGLDYQGAYESNDAAYDEYIEPFLLERVGGGVPDFDVIVPTNWLAARMVIDGLAEPLPIELIPNHVNIDPAYLTNDWDRGSRFQMPWQAGITGIAYDPAATGRPIGSVGDLFSAEFAGRVAMIGEMREAVGLAMLVNGDDPTRPTEETAAAGFALVTDAVNRGQFRAATYGDFAAGLASGEFVAAMAWSGDTVLLQADRPDIEFVIPEEGAISWFDTMVIPADAANVGSAGRFMNWAYDPVNAAQLTSWVQYVSPVVGVQDELSRLGGESAALAQSPILFPDAATRNRLFTWGSGLDRAVEDQLEADFFDLIDPILTEG
jgi:spermidine/putrescine transport system substrate-binding protein